MFLSMLLYPLLNLLAPFSRTFNIKGNGNDGKNPHSYTFPDIAFINEEITGCVNEEAIRAINEAAIGATRALRSPSSCFLVSYFTVSVAPTINGPDFLVTLQF